MSRIKYNRGIKIAGVGQTPWQRFGPQYWFDNYKIIVQSMAGAVNSQFGSEIFVVPENFDSNKSRDTIGNLINSEWFNKLLDKELCEYDIMFYRSTNVEGRHKNRFIGNDVLLTDRFENKVKFREMFRRDVRFPDFEVVDITDRNIIEKLQKLLQKWGTVIIQDEELSAGRGTFIAKNKADAVRVITTLKKTGRKVVVSKRLSGYDISVQCCSTKYGVFHGPPQMQLIDNELLGNKSLQGVEKFNGVQAGDVPLSADNVSVVYDYVQTIGSKLRSYGFRGIFSVDLFYDEVSDTVYVLEVNPRITGATPLYNILQYNSDIPISLLHILEVGGYKYEISDFKKKDLVLEVPVASLFILRSKENKKVKNHDSFKSGTYSYDGKYINDSLIISSDAVVIQNYTDSEAVLNPGDKIAAVYMKRGILETKGGVNKKTQSLIRTMYSRISI